MQLLSMLWLIDVKINIFPSIIALKWCQMVAVPIWKGSVVHLKSSQRNKRVKKKKAVPKVKLFTISSLDIQKASLSFKYLFCL